MGKKPLSAMSLAELWQLFPIQLRPHSALWQSFYTEERAALREVLPADARIHHIGSTAVPAILAKPIVDLLIEAEADDFRAIDAALLSHGYTCMCAEGARRDYNKGYSEDGFAERVFHLHLRVCGDNDELYFRDYLCEHPAVAAAYEDLKKSLASRYEHDRDAYTAAKGDFVRAYTALAKASYGNRYGAERPT